MQICLLSTRSKGEVCLTLKIREEKRVPKKKQHLKSICIPSFQQQNLMNKTFNKQFRKDFLYNHSFWNYPLLKGWEYCSRHNYL